LRTSSLRIALIASARYPIKEPFAGGLEAHTWALAHTLGARGHKVTLFAGPGSDPALGARELPVRTPVISARARADVSMTSAAWLAEHHAYLQLMVELATAPAFDVVHNNSLHYLPIAMAEAVPIPIVTTFHTPPTPWLESAIQVTPGRPVTFTAVSEHTARAWSHIVDVPHVVQNGVDMHRWRPGTGGGPPVWFGRMVPEKGPHLAIQAARIAGHPLRLAGPVSDPDYYETQVRPLLGHGIEHLGHLTRTELVKLVGGASVTLVTPCWDEPYGLTVAESLACGTPVCGFARGALPEVLTRDCGRLVPPGDVEALATALDETAGLSRAAARERAERHCSQEVMVDGYESLYRELAA
jgi:glycosyltransferase involved in cell wall biosynthesis